jgi:hypothetical protein
MQFVSKHTVAVLILINRIYSIIPSTRNYHVHLTISITQHVSAEISHHQVFLNHIFLPPM